MGNAETVVYYDDPIYRPFWATIAALNVPFYLHPRDPLPSRVPAYDGHPWLRGASWAFGVETATHALRLMASGIFDTHPGLTAILGHLGEMLPVLHLALRSPRHQAAPRDSRAPAVHQYLRANFYVTTSGNFHTPTLVQAVTELGVDRVLFSVDYPFEEVADAAGWFDNAEISEADRMKIGRTNAQRFFNL